MLRAAVSSFRDAGAPAYYGDRRGRHRWKVLDTVPVSETCGRTTQRSSRPSGAARAANAVVGRRAVADEVVQEAFADVVRSLDSFDATRPFRPWLMRIVTRRAL